MSDITKATLFMVVSTFSLSVGGLAAKYLAEIMPVTLLVFSRFFFPGLILLSILVFVRLRKPSRALLKPIVSRALCMTACQLCFLSSLQSLTLVESIVLFSTGPLFIPVLEKLIFGVKFNPRILVCLGMTFTGVVLMAGNLSEFDFKPAILVGLMAGFFNSGSQVSLYRASKGELSPAEMNAWTFLIAALLASPIMIYSLHDIVSLNQALITNVGEGFTLSNYYWVGLVLALFAVFTINTQICRAKAYRLVSSGSQLAPLIFTTLLFSAIWQALLFDDTFSNQKLFGIGLIIFASMVNTFLSHRKNKLALKLDTESPKTVNECRL